MDCYVMRGMTLFTDQPRNFFDLKVTAIDLFTFLIAFIEIFLDVDADIRLTRICECETNQNNEKVLIQWARQQHSTKCVEFSHDINL